MPWKRGKLGMLEREALLPQSARGSLTRESKGSLWMWRGAPWQQGQPFGSESEEEAHRPGSRLRAV